MRMLKLLVVGFFLRILSQGALLSEMSSQRKKLAIFSFLHLFLSFITYSFRSFLFSFLYIVDYALPSLFVFKEEKNKSPYLNIYIHIGKYDLSLRFSSS